MPVVPTSLLVTPLFDGTKRMTAAGTVAVNEQVAVTVVGVNDVTTPETPVVPPGLVLRLVSLCGRVEYARFPATTGDAWGASGANATCTLLLNTANMRLLFRCLASNDTREVEVKLENGTTDNLYGRTNLIVLNWIQNPLDPVAGSTQIQTQIDTLTTRIEEHQHDATVEGESAFPHNNLTERDSAGAHPTIEAGVANAALAAVNAQAAAEVAGANATAGLELAQAVDVRLDSVETWRTAFDGVEACPATGNTLKSLVIKVNEMIGRLKG